MVRGSTWAALGFLATITTAGMGCEIIAAPDRSQIPGSGGATTTTSTGGTTTTTSQTGGMSTGGTGGTGGMATGGTGGTGTGGMATGGTGGTGTGGTGTGGTGTGGTGGSTTCGATQKMCNGTCVSVDDPAYGCDPTACTPCDTTHTTTVVCQNNACSITQCATNYDDCNHDASDGCETDLTTPASCGACGSACAMPDQCHTLGACDPATKSCAQVAKADGASCNDGNACTQADTCQAGTCTGGNAVTCAASDACHVAGTCNPATGTCTNPAGNDGASCDDGNLCTTGDTCAAGTCAGTAVTCAASDACHVAGTCNPATGTCTNPAGNDGASCSDGNLCTTNDMCMAGTCAGTAVTCAASDACHVAGTCNPATGTCTNPAGNDGATCNDNDLCTTNDTCSGGTCAGTAVTCAASDACHVAGTCDPQSGTCTNPAGNDGATCNDNDLCTTNDTCSGGTCAGTAVTCSASDQCHVAGTCDSTTGACTNPAAGDGTACDDGNSCTGPDQCMAGVCTGQNPITCATSTCGTGLTAFNGSQTAGWQFNGSASYDGTAKTAVLADGSVTTGQAGTVIYKDAITADSFTTQFDFKITNNGNGRADGIVFMIETNGSSSVGSAYGGFGALGLTGYGVELDVFDSGPCDPGNGNHAGVDQLSACSSNSGIPSAVATSPDLYVPVDAGDNGIGDIGDGQWRTVTAQFTSGQVSVSITDPSTGSPVAVTNLQNVSLPGWTSGTAYYFGFAAGSGSNSLASRHEIRNVQVTFPSSVCL